MNMKIDYPVGYDDKDFEGMEWSTGLGIGRVIPIGERIQSVVLTTWDPTYRESKSLSLCKQNQLFKQGWFFYFRTF